MEYDMIGFMFALFIGCTVGFGSYVVGQEHYKQDLIQGCIDQNSNMAYKDVVPHCQRVVETWYTKGRALKR